MSGKNSFKKRDDDWRCAKCNNLNFGWRLQCNRCKIRKTVNSNDEGGLGVGTALLVGAGAAAVGFLAQGLWSAFQGSSSSSAASAPPQPTGAANPVDEERKKKRDAFRAKNVPKEMKCAICLVNPREVCMLPCGDIYLCEDCAEEVETKCPMCQQPVERKTAIYM